MEQKEIEIDFVIAWVDGADTRWQKERAEYSGKEEQERLKNGQDDREERYRDWEQLKYWFRGVERYAPWVHRIYFVTCGHLPVWLHKEHPKLTLVNHRDYIEEAFLPTFNSHTIELNLHRIKGLSEHFVYFNDDMFLLRKVKKEDFFVRGLPRDMLAFQPIVANEADDVMPYIYLNNAMVLAKYFRKRENVKKQSGAYFHFGYPPLYFFYNFLELLFERFTGFYTVHGPSAFLKSTFEKVWEKEEGYLKEVCGHRFRDRGDVSQYLLREWQKLCGTFVPANVKRDCRYFDADSRNEKLCNTIRKHSAKMICINDSNHAIAFAQAKAELITAFEEAFPQKSEFER